MKKTTCTVHVSLVNLVIVWFNRRAYALFFDLNLIVMQKENPTEFFEIFIAGTKTSKSFFILSTLDSTTNHQDMCSRLVLSVVVACPAARFSSSTGTRTHSADRDDNTCARLIHNKRTMTKIKGLDRRLSVSYRGKFHIRHSNLSICWPSR